MSATLPGGNGTSDRKCEKHDLEITVLQTRLNDMADTVRSVPELTAEVSGLKVCSEHLKESIDTLTRNVAKQTEELTVHNKHHVKLDIATAKQDTKANVLWYIVFGIIATTVISKVILPLIGF